MFFLTVSENERATLIESLQLILREKQQQSKANPMLLQSSAQSSIASVTSYAPSYAQPLAVHQMFACSRFCSCIHILNINKAQMLNIFKIKIFCDENQPHLLDLEYLIILNAVFPHHSMILFCQ